MSRHANREAARRLRYIARNISSRAKMICLALQEGGTAEFDDRRAGRGQGLARWIEISAGRSRALLADGSCCPAISLELRSLTTAAAALPQHHHHHPPRRIFVQRPSTTPLPPVSGLLLSCDALSCSSPLRSAHHLISRYARRPLVAAAPDTPAQGLSEPPAPTPIAGARAHDTALHRPPVDSSLVLSGLH